ncbi:AraC family transcriptional regulator [Pseudoflavitalea sp. G-6-1-2]|uniref:helix-turn-helix domain-containing protein n=1 Tax=Pseudoflavitalea sp. G-6-1-2 TaxID=2728841 RepID=UPI00146BEFB5|nr:helix-turn-helix domain-containing protein [Pseudoflavitalea sp. G-6-1-2]NML21118.1 AraC family transcriptional regulator [Pseudoflavitalea sp. G-6-1-2]
MIFVVMNMKAIESAESFYRHRGITHTATNLFNVFDNGEYCTEPLLYIRRDFYKISLLLGKCKLNLHDKEIQIDKPALVFYHPQLPFSWTPLSPEQPGYFCMFKKEFLIELQKNSSLQQSPLFRPEKNGVFFLNKEQLKNVRDIFRSMLRDIDSDYAFKYDLLRSRLQLLIHESLKMEPDAPFSKSNTAAERITASFLELLERQFPIDTPERILKLRSASDFANALSVHVNHLNNAVKKSTGKPTSVHISERIVTEADSLLKHSDWPVADIAYSLGFEYPNYFYNFYKKQTGHAPGITRQQAL